MQFKYLLLFFVHFQNSHTLESETSKTITVKGKAFMCLFHIQYDENTCFQNSTVSCSPNTKKKRTAKNVALELNDGTKINIKKLKISRKKDRIIKCEVKFIPDPNIAADPLFTKVQTIAHDTVDSFSVKMNPSIVQSVCQHRSPSSSSFEFNKKVFSYKGKVPPRSSLFESEDGTQAIFTCSQGTALYGSIPTEEGAVNFELRSNSRSTNDQIAVFVSESEMSANDHVVPDPLPKSTMSESTEKLLMQGTSDTTTLARYSIKFYYTPEFAADTPDISSFIDQALAVVNQGYRNSRVPLEAYSVCNEQANINDPNSPKNALKAFENLKGSWEKLRGGADVAALLVMSLTGNIAGYAWLHTLNSGRTFSVTVKSYVSWYFTLGHEIGHNIGLAHDRATSKNSVYPYGHGHHIRRGVSHTGYRTIMAYTARGHKDRLNFYSNPSIIYRKTKTPMGVEGVSNNVAVLLRNRFVLENIGNGECDGTTNPTPSSCNVIDGPAKGKTCIFPFTWQGKTYTECAYEPSQGDTFPWCSTKVDASGNHVSGGGHWGKCNPDTCAVQNPPTPVPSICNVIDGPAEGKTCVFPFIWKGKTYTECAFEPSLGDTFPWCSTMVDASGNHVIGGGHWGKCNPDTCAVNPNPPSTLPPSPCNVIDGPAEGKTCVFPFTWKGKTYTECAYEPSLGDTYPWCSTKVDASGNHVSGGGHWGKCNPDTCAVTSVTSQCGIENLGQRISGGQVTRPNQYPWMVRLNVKKTDGKTLTCGGSLITDRHVLTAKHCLDYGIIRESRVKYSVHNQYDPSDYQQVSIKRFLWPNGRNHDIAIIVLAIPVNLNDKTIGTVCLPEKDDEDYRGKSAMAMGWGWTPATSSQSKLLQHIKQRVDQRQEKNWLYTDVDFGNGIPLDVCRGDSGGPLVYKKDGKWTVIGTVASGKKCDVHGGTDDGRLGKWNRVTSHLTWIKNIVATT